MATCSRLHFIHLGNEKELCVPVSCLKDRHRSLLVSVAVERSGVTDVGVDGGGCRGVGAMDQVVTKDEKREKVGSEDRTTRWSCTGQCKVQATQHWFSVQTSM